MPPRACPHCGSTAAEATDYTGRTACGDCGLHASTRRWIRAGYVARRLTE